MNPVLSTNSDLQIPTAARCVTGCHVLVSSLQPSCADAEDQWEYYGSNEGYEE